MWLFSKQQLRVSHSKPEAMRIGWVGLKRIRPGGIRGDCGNSQHLRKRPNWWSMSHGVGGRCERFFEHQQQQHHRDHHLHRRYHPRVQVKRYPFLKPSICFAKKLLSGHEFTDPRVLPGMGEWLEVGTFTGQHWTRQWTFIHPWLGQLGLQARFVDLKRRAT